MKDSIIHNKFQNNYISLSVMVEHVSIFSCILHFHFSVAITFTFRERKLLDEFIIF